jgi:predicted nucleic acid-binding protein
MIVADSDVLIDALRGRDPAMARVASGLRAGILATTAVSVFELRAGARPGRERDTVDLLLGGLTILPFDEAAAVAAADVRRELEDGGQAIGMADYLIAGICIARSAVLVTRNRRHFERVTGLVLGELDS